MIESKEQAVKKRMKAERLFDVLNGLNVDRKDLMCKCKNTFKCRNTHRIVNRNLKKRTGVCKEDWKSQQQMVNETSGSIFTEPLWKSFTYLRSLCNPDHGWSGSNVAYAGGADI